MASTHDRDLRITYVGGPTALIEWGGLRLLTDPTFDPAGTTYELPAYTLRKTMDPALAEADLGRIDAVLLSHDHHFDNLDRRGRALLGQAQRVISTSDGAERLEANVSGLSPWETTALRGPDGGELRITATPARHGPEGGDRGPCIGFASSWTDDPERVLYFTGDTVLYEGVREVAQRFAVTLILPCLGAAQVSAAGPSPLTLTAAEAVELARLVPEALLVPLHYEGWEHFSQSRREVEEAFARAGLAERVRWLEPGMATAIAV
jgi:L-ascorbate metabolism protein UlaG (beta-lactamase superfamily)